MRAKNLREAGLTLAACGAALIAAAALLIWLNGQKPADFAEATGLDLIGAHIALAEYMESEGGSSAVSVAEEVLHNALLSARVQRGKRREAMPDPCFFLHLALADGQTTELVVGSGGEIIVGKPEARTFWTDADGLAYRRLRDAVLPNAG